MKHKITYLLILSIIGAALLSEARAEDISLETARPVVVKSTPEAGADGVDPSTTQISVTFSKNMQGGSWSWCVLSKETYPGTGETPKYLENKRTCVLPVKLQPGKTYAVWINSDKFHDFVDTKGQLAVPYLLVFKTRE
jgi:RNA polymerase sigma-70 factor (ECF subfamily)